MPAGGARTANAQIGLAIRVAEIFLSRRPEQTVMAVVSHTTAIRRRIGSTPSVLILARMFWKSKGETREFHTCVPALIFPDPLHRYPSPLPIEAPSPLRPDAWLCLPQPFAIHPKEAISCSARWASS